MTEKTPDKGLVDTAKALLSQLESGEHKNALQTIANLQQQRDNLLFQEIGKLTRSLHESIKNFSIDSGNSQMREEMSRMEDASQRLNYVIEKTEDAANKTLDKVESTMPVSAELGDGARSIKKEWDKLMRRQLTPDEFRQLSKKMDAFLTLAARDSAIIESNLSDILMAQDFQDLTGQVIKRVIQLVKEVEDSLVSLVTMAVSVDDITGITHDLPDLELTKKDNKDNKDPEGPVINPEQRTDVVNGQDDVDALLSSLGF